MFRTCVLTGGLLLSAAWAQAQDAAHGRQVFDACSSCHIVNADRHGFGPSLKGVFGRQAGSAEGYAYSEAMRKAGEAGLVWDEATLSAFLASPAKAVPGTKMRFWGLWGESEIKDVIAFLQAHP
ncbi:cytochrome C [Xaviernesmea oryzae]|uniref:Cytochrome C n=1 Tax=Xaviernesmea oryzae TaxID=464029 RepID=A0A1Q9ASL4_9HYPH|nr:cytochrome c family protein [Xaviernesmea oryzae]OLP58422.1 cytochrome C [Xaviernesmea oryzae]SEM21614.1 cytochrome c [Xaviernesmea oryzae]